MSEREYNPDDCHWLRGKRPSIMPPEAAPEITRPEIVCLCGSSRFVAEMAVIAWTLERDEGVIVLGLHLLPAWYTSQRDHQAEHEDVGAHMDELHLRKIDLAARLLVVNIDGYIGESTRREIAYGERQNKPVAYVEARKEGKK